MTHKAFQWQNLPCRRKGTYCDVKGGRAKAEHLPRGRHHRRLNQYATLSFNDQEIGAYPTITEAQQSFERLYAAGHF